MPSIYIIDATIVSTNVSQCTSRKIAVYRICVLITQGLFLCLQEWIDEFMRWDPADFSNITMLRIPCHKLWLPDMVLYNK